MGAPTGAPGLVRAGTARLLRARVLRARGWLVAVVLLTIAASIGIAVASISTAPTGQKSWYWQNPVPQGNTLYGVDTAGVSDVWAVGGPGVILHSDDDGFVWDAQDSNTVATLESVDFVDTNNGWTVGLAFGGQSTIRRTADGGSTWATQTAGSTTSLYGVSMVDATTGWVVGQTGTIRRTWNAGSTWNGQVSGTAQTLNSVSSVDTNTAWAVGAAGTIKHTTDGGSTWTTQTSPVAVALNGISAVSASTAWIVGNTGTVMRTLDGGSTWTTQSAGTAGTLYAAKFVSSTTGWVVGNAGVIEYTTDGGLTWAAQTSGSLALQDVAAFSASKAQIVGTTGTMLRTGDAGQTWTAQSPGSTQVLNAVSFVTTQSGWAVGGAGTIKHTTDGGDTWTKTTTGISALRGVDFVDENRGWVVGAAGTIKRSTDGGHTWTSQVSPVALQLNAVSAVSTSSAWVVGATGTILRTTDGGSTWTTRSAGTAANLNGVCFLDANTGWVVGQTGTIRKTIDGGATWTTQTFGANTQLYAVCFTDANNGWAVGATGRIISTTNGGTTWTTRSSAGSALYAVAFSGSNGWAVGGVAGSAAVIRATTDGGVTWTTQSSGMTGVLRGVTAGGPQTAWTVGDVGAIRRTLDGGSTWATQIFGTTNNLYGVAFADPDTGFAVGLTGTVMRTRDGGATWASLVSSTTQNLNAVDFVSPTTGWAVGNAGIIRRTTDGTNWTIQPTATVALRGVDFIDASTGWAVGDAGTILHTTDGGVTPWTAQASGITNGMAVNGVSFIDASNGWAVAGTVTPVGSSAILHTADGGSTWTTQPVDVPANRRLYAISMLDANRGWAVGENGVIRATTNGGATWTTQTAPIGTTALYGVKFVDANRGWAVGAVLNNQAVVIRTTDGGANWALQPSGTLSILRAVAFTDVDHGWTVGDAGGTLRTTDGTPPSTTISYDPPAPDGLGGWYVTTPTIELLANESAITRYSVNATNGPYVTYSSPVDVSSPGTVTVRYYSVDPGGNRETTQSAVLRIDLTPPSVPTSVSASALSTSSVRVSWSPSLDTVSGLAYYEVRQDGSLVGTTAAMTTVIASLTPETAHVYTVRAVDVAGNVTGDSSPAFVGTWALLSRPPLSVYARHAYRGTFYVDWDEPTNTVGAVSYHVWRSDANGPYVNIASVAGLLSRSYIDTTAPDPTPISYAISVLDARGEGATSTARASASATTPVLPSPTRLRALAVTGSVETSWVSLPSTSVAGYAVLRSTTSTGAPVTVTPSPVASPSFNDTSAVAHTEYWYRVAAIDQSGVRGSASLPVYVRAEASATADIPHGSFTADTDACALCHSMHASENATALLTVPGTDESPLCFSCHDGTSASDVFSEFADTTRVDRHAVAAGSMPGTTRCAACHDPHGDKGVAARRGLLYNGGARTGDAVCYNGCHGATATVTPRGDLHGFEGSGHASGTPLPADGSQVKCLACHVSHSSREGSLYPFAPDERCLNCHSADGALPGAADIAKSLSGPDQSTRHDLLQADQAATGARMACGNCHEPHSSSPATKLVDPDDPKTTGGWNGTVDDFCLRCHDAALPTSVETTGWVLPPLGSGGTAYTSNIASRWAGDIHGALVRSPLTLRADMGYAAGDPVGCNKCHDDHGSSNRWALRESVTSKSGATTVSGLLVYPVGGGADVRYFCNACHDVTAASHPATSAGGADISVFPMDCTSAGCHAHGASGL